MRLRILESLLFMGPFRNEFQGVAQIPLYSVYTSVLLPSPLPFHCRVRTLSYVKMKEYLKN